MSQTIVSDIFSTIKSFDRISKNPDDGLLQDVIEQMYNKAGLIRFILFACPNFKPKALITESPEKFMPVEVTSDDLFVPRIPKIKELRSALWKNGVPSTIDVFIGDNDLTECLQDSLKVTISKQKLTERQNQYLQSFEARMKAEFGQLYTVWSFSSLGIGIDVTPNIADEVLLEEINFFKWLFSESGPYKGIFEPNATAIRDMALKTCALYGSQGLALDEMFWDSGGGILLRTGRPNEWLQGTQTFRCMGGSKFVPAIYPYIRKEDLTTNIVV